MTGLVPDVDGFVAQVEQVVAVGVVLQSDEGVPLAGQDEGGGPGAVQLVEPAVEDRGY
jgi:hypothetical protein